MISTQEAIREEILATMRTPGWQYIVQHIKRELKFIEQEIISIKQINAYNLTPTTFFDEHLIWYQRGVILGIKHFLKTCELTLNQKNSFKRVNLLKGFYLGLNKVLSYTVAHLIAYRGTNILKRR